jgi:hypothetical protein
MASSSHITAAGDPAPAIVRTWLQPFRRFFTAPVWEHVLILLMGALLAPGKRTVTAALRITGRRGATNFTSYHQVLNRARWSGRAVACRLLSLIVERLVPAGPVVIGVDDTIERRWGPKITARGIYRDPVRSSHAHFVKTSGLRWLSFMVLCPVAWAGRVKALPFLSVLAPSERCNHMRGKPHKRLTDWARQGILQTCRWLPNRRIVFVGDSGFAVLDLLSAVRHRCAVVSRLRLDANLYAPPPARGPRTLGRPASKGRPLPKLKAVAEDRATRWRRIVASEWYGEEKCELDITSGTGLWYRPSSKIVPLRWVLVRDPSGQRPVQAFFSTDPDLSPQDILAFFVRRWQVEVTFAEVRAHLGVETQRQWSDLAILRTTPALLGLYSLVTMWADNLLANGAAPYAAAWYTKTRFTFSDAIAAVRMQLWTADIYPRSVSPPDHHKIPTDRIMRMAHALCYAA